MAVHAQWHMPLIFQARSNPAGVVISNSFHINGSSLGSSCVKAVFSNLNLSSFLFSTPIFLSNHFSYWCWELPEWCCSLCFGLFLYLLAKTLCVSIYAVAPPLSWRRQPMRDTASRVTPPCLQTHLCCYNTEVHVRAHVRVFPGSHVRFLFYWLLFFFLIREQGQASWNLPSTPAADERSGLQPSHLSWPLILPCHNT